MVLLFQSILIFKKDYPFWFWLDIVLILASLFALLLLYKTLRNYWKERRELGG